ncbi:hypothetical protein AGMMS4952_00830 [Spirochaetia bacterium]|nr:hypothetical protein AGMMS4952_00830 [Spirochaetia bacterium]
MKADEAVVGGAWLAECIWDSLRRETLWAPGAEAPGADSPIRMSASHAPPTTEFVWPVGNN